MVTVNLFYAERMRAEHPNDTGNPPDARIARILADLTVVKLWARAVAHDYLRDDHEAEYIVGRCTQIEEQIARLREYGT